MKRYDKYKPSGVEWIGEIPEHWEVKKLKYVAEVNSTSLTEKEENELVIEYIDISAVNENGEISQTATHLYSDSPSRARRIIRKGDTIISTVRTYLKAIAFIDFEKANLICSTGFAVIRPSEKLEPKFLFYLSRSEKMVDRIMALSKGVSYPAIDSEDINWLDIWYPEIDEQTAIASFLDEKTAQIDTLIEKKKKLIELLKEERTAIINQAVTKGLNHDEKGLKDVHDSKSGESNNHVNQGSDNVRLKPSGIEWLGEIPEHWEATKLGYMGQMIVPMRDKPKDLNGPVPWLRIEDFDGKYVSNSKSNQGVTEDTIREMNLKVFPVGTVLCSCSCAMGKTAIVNKPLITNQTFIGIVPSKKINSVFLYYLMQASEQYLNSISSGAIQTYLAREDFESLKIILPDLAEQTAIASFLDEETAQIDAAISKIEKEIALLQEYRTALISEVVTGKIKVI